jgi:porin
MKHKFSTAVTTALLLGLCGLTSPVLADSLPTPPSSNLPAVDADKLSAFLLRLQYTGEVWNNTGGAKDGGVYLQGADVSLNVDAEKLGLPGARFFFEGFYVAGESIGLNAGTFSPPSALDALFSNDEVFRFYQAFYEQQIDNTNLVFGFYDLQQQLGALRPSELFFNRALGLNLPLTLNGYLAGMNSPSIYPYSTLGMRVKQKFSDEWTAKLAVLNGMADNPEPPNHNDLIINSHTGILGVGEIDYTPADGTKFMAGYWNSTAKFTSWELNPDFTRRQYYGADGFYFGAATRLFTIDGNRKVDGFFNWGISDEGATVVDNTVNAGLNITGLLADRPEDKFGIAVSVAHVAEPFRNIQALGGITSPEIETAIEVTYRARLTDWLTIQPDFQYIIDPAVALGSKEEFIFGVHFEIGRSLVF